MEKIGLVIQGPLVSIGKSGYTAHIPKAKLVEDDIVHYDCRQNIQKIIDDFGELFDAIVISTWDNELRPGDQWRGATVVSMPDPGGIKIKNSHKDPNKYRQFIGIKRGLAELEKMSKVDYVVRIRTDQYLDLGKLVHSFIESTSGEGYNPGTVFVTAMRQDVFFVHDFYFASSFRTMKKFCDAILAYDMYEFASAAHTEIPIKHAYVLYGHTIGVPDWAYFSHFSPFGVSAVTEKIFTFMFENIYIPLDLKVFLSVVWRGSPFDEKYILGKFRHSEASAAKKRNIPALFSTDWERYFDFCREVRGENLTMRDKFIIWAGKLGWTSWILFRRSLGVVKRARFHHMPSIFLIP